jgi:hypothetical protein
VKFSILAVPTCSSLTGFRQAKGGLEFEPTGARAGVSFIFRDCLTERLNRRNRLTENFLEEMARLKSIGKAD